MPAPAKVIGVLGLTPFVIPGTLVWIVSPVERMIILDMILHYSAIILSFIGAIYWGIAMKTIKFQKNASQLGWNSYGWSVTPALIAWLATLLIAKLALLLLMLGFVAAYFYDLRAFKNGLIPVWYINLRKPLTLIVLICLGSTLGSFLLG